MREYFELTDFSNPCTMCLIITAAFSAGGPLVQNLDL